MPAIEQHILPSPAFDLRPGCDWRQRLTPEQLRIMRRGAMETPFGRFYDRFREEGEGVYCCAGCGAKRFSSHARLDSHCGWPAFYDTVEEQGIVMYPSGCGTGRMVVHCVRCGCHLGRMFAGEGYATPTDRRYSINRQALNFVPASPSPS